MSKYIKGEKINLLSIAFQEPFRTVESHKITVKAEIRRAKHDSLKWASNKEEIYV